MLSATFLLHVNWVSPYLSFRVSLNGMQNMSYGASFRCALSEFRSTYSETPTLVNCIA